MPDSTQYKAVPVSNYPNTDSFVEAFTLSVLLQNLHDSTKFSRIFTKLFGLNEEMLAIFLDLKDALSTYIPPAVPDLLVKLIQMHVRPKLAAHLRQQGSTFLSPTLQDQIEASAQRIEQSEPTDAVGQEAFSNLLQVKLCTYTHSRLRLSMPACITYGSDEVNLLVESGQFHALLAISKISSVLQQKFQSLPTHVFQTDTEVTVMKEIYCLTDEYNHHLQNSWFNREHLKAYDLLRIRSAQTPQVVMNILFENHRLIPYQKIPRHQVLNMNRTPWWLRLIQSFFILITFPLSIPLLMIFSWKMRGTVNFIKPKGSIYLEKILKLCRQAGVVAPEPPTYTSPVSFPQSKATTQQNLLIPFRALVTEAAAAPPPASEPSQPSIQEASPLPLDYDASVKGMGNMAGAFTQVFRDNPTMFLEAELSRTTGEPVIMGSSPLEQIGPHQYRLKFDYASHWTQPWQELTPYSTTITLFSKFTPLRQAQTTNQAPMNVTPPIKQIGRTYAYFRYDCKTLIALASENHGGPLASKYYVEALTVAKNNEECVTAIEAQINWVGENLEDCEQSRQREAFRGEHYFQDWNLRLTQRLNELLDALPINYPEFSITARAIQACFDKTWAHLARNELALAWQAFDSNQTVKKMRKAFVYHALPHLRAMRHQLVAIFFLHGYVPVGVRAKDIGIRLKDAMLVLQKYHAPEAVDFEEGAVKPFLRLTAHVEDLFSQTSYQDIHKHALEEFRDDRIWELEGKTKAYCKELRGKPITYTQYPELLARSREVLALTAPREAIGSTFGN